MRYVVILFCLLLALAISPLSAQDETCPSLVESALETVRDLCDGTGRNQVCYGNIQLASTAASDAPEFTFEAPGDLADVTYIDSLELSSMQSPDEWGIALMKIQANLPDTLPGQNVNMLLFGDVMIENQAVEAPEPLSGTITGSANLRSGPSTNFAVVGAGSPDQEVVVDGRNEAGDWFHFIRPDSDGETAWIFESLIEIEGDIDSLQVLAADENAIESFGPMQAFFFRSGIGDIECQEAPRDGILVQTPGAAESSVTLSINDVRIELGSTAFLTAVPGDYMTITLLEGQARVTAQGSTVVVPTGLRAQIPLDEAGLAAGPPELVTYEAEEVAAVPVGNLDEPVELPEPLDIPYLQYAGDWVISASAAVLCPNGLIAVGASPARTITLEATPAGLMWGNSVFTTQDGSVFNNTSNVDAGGVLTTRFEFSDGNTGTYTYIFDSQGKHNYACDQVSRVSTTMSRP